MASADRTSNVTALRGASLRSVYLSPQLLAPEPQTTTLFAVSLLAREMFLHAMRWGPDREENAQATTFFAAIAALLPEWLQSRIALSLPSAESPELTRVMRRIQESPTQSEVISVASLARASGLSGRTLQRRFMEEPGVSYRQYLLNARVLTAMELLGQSGSQVRQVAFRVGFKSEAAFTGAFPLCQCD